MITQEGVTVTGRRQGGRGEAASGRRSRRRTRGRSDGSPRCPGRRRRESPPRARGQVPQRPERQGKGEQRRRIQEDQHLGVRLAERHGEDRDARRAILHLVAQRQGPEVGRLPEDEDQEQEYAVHAETRFHGGVPDEDRQGTGDGAGDRPVRRAALPYQRVQDRIPCRGRGKEQTRRGIEEQRRQQQRGGDRRNPRRRDVPAPEGPEGGGPAGQARHLLVDPRVKDRVEGGGPTRRREDAGQREQRLSRLRYAPPGEHHPGEAGQGHRRNDAGLDQQDRGRFV